MMQVYLHPLRLLPKIKTHPLALVTFLCGSCPFEASAASKESAETSLREHRRFAHLGAARRLRVEEA